MQNLLNVGKAAQGAQAQMQAEHDPNVGFPWWVRFLAKGLAIVGGFVALFFAILGLLTVTPRCMIAVLLQGAAGFLSIALEAPFCCAFVDFIERIAAFSESRAYWQKAALYGGYLFTFISRMGIIPILMCPELNTILGAGTIFASGVVYGFMALGKKADRNTMMGVDPAWSPQVNQPFPSSGSFNQP